MPSKMINGQNYAPPRTATYVIAASDATALEKAQADVVCDGAADDVQIQAAIDLYTNSGKTISLSSGVFTVSTAINYRSGVYIKGAGMGATTGGLKAATTLTVPNVAANAIFANLQPVAFGGISDMNLEGNSSGGATGDIFVGTAVGSFLVENVRFSYAGRDGISLVANSEANYFINVFVDYAIRYGIYLNASGGNVFIGGTVAHTTDAGIRNNASNQNHFIGGIDISYCSGGFQDVASQGTKITGNHIYRNTYAGIYSESATDFNYSGNTIESNSTGGANWGDGIQLANGGSGGCFRGIIALNNIYDLQNPKLQRNGVRILDAVSADIVIKDNNVQNNLSVGLLILGTGHIVQDNKGYIALGEIRTYSGSIATLTENSFNSLDNPFGQSVRVLSVDIYVSTAATATSPNIDVGIGTGATTDYTTLFDDLPGETTGFYNSLITTPGTQTVPQLWESGSGVRYLNFSIKDAVATGMVATYVITVMGN